MQVERLDIIKKMKIGKVTITKTVIGNSFREMMNVMISDISREPIKYFRELKER